MLLNIFNNNFKKIKNHNKSHFPNQTDNKKKKIILVEFNNFTANHIGLSYLSNILKKKYDSKIIAYFGHILLTYDLERNFYTRVKIKIGKLLNLNFFGVYKSFGVSDFFYPQTSNKIIFLKEKVYKKFQKQVKTLKDLELFKISGVQVGDLLYDTYLKKNYHLVPTIELDDKKFIEFAKDFIALFLIWEDFFKKNNVKAVIGSHSVYSLAIPLRIALKKKQDAYVLTPQYLQKLNKNIIYQSGETHYFKKIFKKIDYVNKKILIKDAKKRIKTRLEGKYSSDYPYVTKSPFGSLGKKIFTKNKKKIKVLIATHDFFDGAHACGIHLFPDYYHWFKFLCEMSKKTDYEWYVKTHPLYGKEWGRYVKYERYVVKNILKDFKDIKLLPSSITHNQIIEEKIDAVFTVHGTIAHEFALHNILTINSSLNNPHINYDFTLHPKSQAMLKEIILNIKKYKSKLNIDKKEIIEFYSLKNIFFSKNWFLENYSKTIKDLGYHGLEGGKIEFYNYWIKNFDINKHKKLNEDIINFVNSKNLYLLNNNGLGKF